MRMHSLEHLVVTSNVEGKRARGRQRLKFLENLHVYMLGGQSEPDTDVCV